jgi:hypothetical protein
MANTRARNVIKVDTTATFSGQTFIHSIKYIGGTSGAAVITDANSGNRLWEQSGTTNYTDSDICISATEGITVSITATCTVYLYLE